MMISAYRTERSRQEREWPTLT